MFICIIPCAKSKHIHILKNRHYWNDYFVSSTKGLWGLPPSCLIVLDLMNKKPLPANTREIYLVFRVCAMCHRLLAQVPDILYLITLLRSTCSRLQQVNVYFLKSKYTFNLRYLCFRSGNWIKLSTTTTRLSWTC